MYYICSRFWAELFMLSLKRKNVMKTTAIITRSLFSQEQQTAPKCNWGIKRERNGRYLMLADVPRKKLSWSKTSILYISSSNRFTFYETMKDLWTLFLDLELIPCLTIFEYNFLFKRFIYSNVQLSVNFHFAFQTIKVFVYLIILNLKFCMRLSYPELSKQISEKKKFQPSELRW